jgi:hypothetical protein
MVTARAYGQASLSYYPFSSIVGISSNPDKIAWADLRIQTNTFLSNTNMEFCPMLNFKRDSVKKCYVGAGVNFNVIYGLVNDRYINGYSVTVGSRISPFHKVRNLSFIIELSPYINAEFSGATLRTNLGIGWHFRHRTRT